MILSWVEHNFFAGGTGIVAYPIPCTIVRDIDGPIRCCFVVELIRGTLVGTVVDWAVGGCSGNG